VIRYIGYEEAESVSSRVNWEMVDMTETKVGIKGR
jgi:hypothetical protein